MPGPGRPVISELCSTLAWASKLACQIRARWRVHGTLGMRCGQPTEILAVRNQQVGQADSNNLTKFLNLKQQDFLNLRGALVP